MARRVVIEIPDDIPEEWVLGQIVTLVIRRRISGFILEEIIKRSKLEETVAEEIGERLKALAWKKLKERLNIRD